MSTVLRAFRHRNYRLFFAGQGISMIGMWIQNVAQAWLVYRLTDASFAVGALAIAQQGPGLFIGPIAGALADRHPKRRLLLIAQSASLLPAIVLGVLTIGDLVTTWHVFACSFFAGVARACEIPIRQSFIHDLVGRDDLPNAIALNSVLFNAARLIGPSVGGVLIATVGEGWCFMANACSYAPILMALAAMRLPEAQTGSRAESSIVSDIVEGVRYVRGQPVVWALLGGLATASLAGR